MLTTYEYEGLVDYTPSLNHMLIITGTDKKQSKIIVNTNQVGPVPYKADCYLLFLPGLPDVQFDQRIHGEDCGDSGKATCLDGQWK